jgi:hypothetical protein
MADEDVINLPDPPRYPMIDIMRAPVAVYDPAHWYWEVGGSEGSIWSTVSGQEINHDDTDYKAWRDRGNLPSRIDTFDSLLDVLTHQAPAAAEVLRQAKFPNQGGGG